MKPSPVGRSSWLLGAATVALTGLLVTWALAGRPQVAAGGTFNSPIHPTHTPKPTNTARPRNTPTSAPTLGAFLSPLGTPTAASDRRLNLPLVMKPPTPFPTPGPYGWKGIGDTWEAKASGLDAAPANQFWGLAPSWWYDWGYRVRDAAVQSATSLAGTLAILEAGLNDIGYVPMLFCPSDADPVRFLSPQDAAGLARKYPGRVWLLFNEPDNLGQCGAAINGKYSGMVPANPVVASPQDWEPLGKYLGEQYILYYDAIKAADPAAKLFAFNPVQLPLPTLSGTYWKGGVALWNAFLKELSSRGRPLDGIAIHAYPSNASTYHTGCQWYYYLEPGCMQEALASAYKFFQGTDATPSQNLYAALTSNKPIWITEIGTLATLNAPVLGQPLTWPRVRDGFETPMVNWLKQNSMSGGGSAYINGVAWFSTYCKDPYHSPPWYDYTASNLLDHLSFPAQRRLTEVGAAWRDANCATCQCPGPGCP